MSCPKCKGNNITLGGKYKIKRTDIKIRRFICKDCGFSFVRRTKRFRIKIPLKIRNKIMRLYKTKKPYKNKFDNLKKETYSMREIAKMLKVSKSFVFDVIKKMGDDVK